MGYNLYPPHQFVSSDGKKHAVNCAALEGIFRIIQSIPSKKAEPVKRNTMPSSAELDVRERFATVSAAVADRRKDLTKITTDQIAFKAQKDIPGGCRTMTKYLWKVEGDIYDAARPRG